MDKKIGVDNHLAKETPIEKGNPDFGTIEYQLQLSLGSTTAVVKNIWKVQKPHLTSRFGGKSNSLLLDSWIPISTLEGVNSVQNVIPKGFDIDAGKGRLFETGRIKLDPNQSNTYKFLLVKIAVGKSYFMFKEKYKRDMKIELPRGFDSVYLYQEEASTSDYRHDYIVFKSEQVLPVYEVHFEFDPKREQELSAPICESCGKVQAVKFCLTENASFCLDCDSKFHDKEKLLQKHRRVDIKDKPKPYGECQDHPGNKLELYCNTCNQALCVYCKIKGTHRFGEMNNHDLVKIQEVYQEYKGKSMQLDASLQKRKNKIVQLLSNLELKMKDVNKNASAIEAQLYDKMQKCFKELQDRTYEKLSYLVGDQLELRRQFDQIQWAEGFLKYERDVLLPSEFLTAWNRHSSYRRELLKLGNIPMLTDVKADMKIEGELKVITESLLKLQEAQKIKQEEDRLEQQKKLSSAQVQNFGSTALRDKIFSKHLLRPSSQFPDDQEEGLAYLKTTAKKLS